MAAELHIPELDQRGVAMHDSIRLGRWQLCRRRGPLGQVRNFDDPEGTRHLLVLEWNDHDDVMAWLRPLRDEYDFVTRLRAWLDSQVEETIFRMTDEDILWWLAQQIMVGRMEVCATGIESGERGDRGGGKQKGAATETAEDEPPETVLPPVVPEEKSKWLEVVMIDDESGEPQSGITLKLLLPDGSITKRTTDGQGRVRIDDVAPGTFEISEILDRNGMEVVSIE